MRLEALGMALAVPVSSFSSEAVFVLVYAAPRASSRRRSGAKRASGNRPGPSPPRRLLWWTHRCGIRWPCWPVALSSLSESLRSGAWVPAWSRERPVGALAAPGWRC